jgi:hypothetical protein
VFAIAEERERAKNAKKAFAAYHQVATQFPETAEGRKAADRIRRAQRTAMLKRSTSSATSRSSR